VINNPQHVKELREVVHAAISEWGIDRKLGPGDLAARDAVTAIAMVLRDFVQSAPDAASRGQLVREIVTALSEQQRSSLIMPVNAPLVGHA
jgi:hypothetical protein